MKILFKPLLWFAALFLLFLWVVLLNPPSAYSQEPAYCFAVYPDYQYQSSGGDVNKLAAVPAWISANKATYCPNMLFSASTGDDVDTSNSTQWATYVGSSSTGFFDPIQLLGLPFGSDIGNHDYESASPASRVTTQFTSNLLTSSNGIQNEATYGGAWGGAVQDPEVNYWMQIPNGSYTIGLLFLEFCPRTAALAWGAGIIAAHPGFSDWWVFTHEAVTAAGALSTTGSSGTSGCQDNSVDGVNDSTIGGGDNIWAAIQSYPNVRGIFNGHFGGPPYAAHATMTGTSGNDVLRAFVNHQYDAGGSGGGAQTCLTLYNITPGSTTMGVQANTPCPNYNGTGSSAWLPSDNTADAVNNYSTTLQLGSTPTNVIMQGIIMTQGTAVIQ